MSRFFTVFEAERLIPEVRELTELLVRLQRDNEEAEQALTNISQKIMFTGGVVLPRERLFAWKHVREVTQKEIAETISQVGRLGCEVQDLEEGSIGFPSVYQGQKVYLCWKLGEESIGYWHSVPAGLAGRKPIDQDFLEHHSGDIRQ